MTGTQQGVEVMTGLENAQHDLTDAQFSLETAIELLDSIHTDHRTQDQELNSLIQHLKTIKSELASSFSQLESVQVKIEH
jgi:hypothetical protein